MYACIAFDIECNNENQLGILTREKKLNLLGLARFGSLRQKSKKRKLNGKELEFEPKGSIRKNFLFSSGLQWKKVALSG